MARSDRPLRLVARLKGAVRREVRVFGLSAPATVRVEGEEARVEVGAESDRAVVDGFAVAAERMVAMDLARRLWSGRLAELLGERPLEGGLTAVDLDVFVRILGFRDDAERAFKAKPAAQREDLEAFARGVNAWIDCGSWQDDPRWAALRSRPRLWGAADGRLVVGAAARVDGTPPQIDLEAARAAGWTDGWSTAVGTLWSALRRPLLRAPGAVGGWGAEGGEERAAARIVPVEVVPGYDNHRYVRQDGRVGRLRARRPDVTVRGGSPHRAWVRRSDRGGLVSDALIGGGPEAPVGRHVSAPRHPALALDDPWRLVEPAAASASTFRLVPLDGGA